jgi:enamine deaminase RidA (YjgF/YER057c/UK114 family)
MKIVNPKDFPKPRGYSNGITVPVGRVIYVSGQIAWDTNGHIVSPDFGVQFLQALDNVIAVVREAGAATEHIVKLLAFVTDLDAYRAAMPVIGEGWRGRMGKYYPAMSLVKVAGLLEPGALVEIEGMAILPEAK